VLNNVIFVLSSASKAYDDLTARIEDTVNYIIENGASSFYVYINDAAGQMEDTLLKISEHHGEIRLKETLFLTDSPAVAQDLLMDSAYVTGLHHEYNADARFEGVKFIFADIDDVDYDSFVKAYQRMAHEPWHILETERCSIRETTIEDVDKFYEIYSEPSMTKYMEGLFENPDDEKRYTKDYIDKVYGLLGFGTWTILDKETSDIIGRAGFSIRNGFDNVELGFLISVPYQNQGRAVEVCNAILDYGQKVLMFDKVQALVKKENEVSIHILKKLGFEVCDEVDIEENIYGNTYQDGKQVELSEAHYGSYVRMLWSA